MHCNYLVAHRVKDPVLSLPWCESLWWLAFDPCSGNLHAHWDAAKKKKNLRINNGNITKTKNKTQVGDKVKVRAGRESRQPGSEPAPISSPPHCCPTQGNVGRGLKMGSQQGSPSPCPLPSCTPCSLWAGDQLSPSAWRDGGGIVQKSPSSARPRSLC